MPYKLSTRLEWDRERSSGVRNAALGKSLFHVFLVFAVISFVTAAYYNTTVEDVLTAKAQSRDFLLTAEADEAIASIAEEGLQYQMLLAGPFTVSKKSTVYYISVACRLVANSWSYVEAELLDEDREYIFSFGRELWHEAGRDSDGAWEESARVLDLNLTNLEPDEYYILLKARQNPQTGGALPLWAYLSVKRQIGSPIPHALFGTMCLAASFILLLIFRRHFVIYQKVAGLFKASDDDDDDD